MIPLSVIVCVSIIPQILFYFTDIYYNTQGYSLNEIEYLEPISFGLDELSYEKYEAIAHEKRGLGINSSIKKRNIDEIRDNIKYSQYMLIAEIAKYLNKNCTLISKILAECTEGVELVLEKVNLYNDILFDIIVPRIFNSLYEVNCSKKTDERKVLLLREPKDKEYYTFRALPELVIRRDDDEMIRYKERSFHADTYCFDSKPEKECFYQYIQDTTRVKNVFFTGMFTAHQGDLCIPYYDPETKRMRNYYPDFLAEMEDGKIQLIEVKGDNKIDDIVVKAKQSAAQEIASESKMEYIMYAGSSIMNSNILENELTNKLNNLSL